MIEMEYQDAVRALAAATNWHKSSHSQGENACVEVASVLLDASNWRKASYSQGQNACVEVGTTRGIVGVRDTKLGPAGPILAFDRQNWAEFTTQLKAGELAG